MNRRLLSSVLLVGLLVACSDDGTPGGNANGGAGGTSPGGAGSAGKPSSIPSDPPAEVTVERSAEAIAEIVALKEKIAATKGLGADAFVAAHPAPAGQLGYDPAKAAGLEIIQASKLALTESELPTLASNGFAISTSKRYPSFTYGYQSIYAADLPVYISADSILHAVHRGYDSALADIETEQLSPELSTLLTSMRGALASQAASLPGDVYSFSQAHWDVDNYHSQSQNGQRGFDDRTVHNHYFI